MKSKLNPFRSVQLPGIRACYYHVTESENVPSIMHDGLRCGHDEYIYLLTHAYLDALLHAAKCQSDLRAPVVIEVCARGVTATPEPDYVGEAYAFLQVRVHQAVIPSEFLTVACGITMDPEYSPSASMFSGSNAQWRESLQNVLP